MVDEMEVQKAASLLRVCEELMMNTTHVFQREVWRAWLNLVNQLSGGRLSEDRSGTFLP